MQYLASPPRNVQLDGLRGYAAIAVVVYHAIIGLDPTQIQRVLIPSLQSIDGPYDRLTKIVLAMFSGETAVVIFFVMSGAVLFASLQRDEGGAGRLAATFALRRVFRIYPTLIAYLMIATIVFPFFGIPASVESFLLNLSLTDFPLNGASWTLNVEMLAAPLIFVGFLVHRRWRELGLLGFVIAIILLFKAKPFAGHLELFKQFVFCFALGMLIPTKVGAFIGARLPSALWIVFLVAMIFAKHIVLIGGHKTATNIQQISAALLVAMLYYDNAGRLGDFLRRSISVFLGRISYTLYLFNVLFLEIFLVVMRGYPWAGAHPLEAGLGAAAMIVALTIPTAYLVTLSIEEPAIRLGKRWTTRRKLAVAPDIAPPVSKTA